MPSAEPVGSVTCSNCGKPVVQEDDRPCPHCGSYRRTIHVHLDGEVVISGELTGLRKVRKYYQVQTRHLILALSWTILSTLVGFLAGGLIGLVIGLALGILGILLPPARVKVIEEKVMK